MTTRQARKAPISSRARAEAAQHVAWAIRESIATGDLVDIDHTPAVYEEICRVAGSTGVFSAQGWEFFGGDEAARNDWFVRLLHREAAK